MFADLGFDNERSIWYLFI